MPVTKINSVQEHRTELEVPKHADAYSDFSRGLY